MQPPSSEREPQSTGTRRYRVMQAKLHPGLADAFDELAHRHGLSRYALIQACLAHYVTSERGLAALEDIISADEPTDTRHKIIISYFVSPFRSGQKQPQPSPPGGAQPPKEASKDNEQ